MAKFLFTTLPSNDLGLLARALPIARGLADRGHNLAFSSPSDAPRKLLAEAGFVNLLPRHPLYRIKKRDLRLSGIAHLMASGPWKDWPEGAFDFFSRLVKAIPLKFAPQTPQVWCMDHAAAMAGLLNANFVRANCAAYIGLIRQFAPDVVIDFWNPFACIAARVTQKPLITVIQADGHPAGKGFIWWKPKPQGIPTTVPTVNRVLAGFGCKSITRIEDLNLGHLTLIVGTPETDPLPADADGHYIGPLLWQDKKSSLPPWFHALESGRPIVWVYSGNPRYSKKSTAVDSEVILEACISALAGENVHIVLTTGNHPIPEQYLPLPDNFSYAPYLPGRSLAERCDLMIHHGGYGSCQTGLLTGTPAVIIPTFSERESNARRVAALGAGDFMLPSEASNGLKQINSGDFREKVLHVLKTPGFRENAQRYRKVLRAYGGVEKALDLIEGAVTEIRAHGLMN